MHVLKGLVIAFASYTRIPMPQVEWSAENRRWSMCFFPLIGVVVGGLIWLWLALCDGLHIGRIDLELGQLEVQGHIRELSYDEPVQRESLWTRLFG